MSDLLGDLAADYARHRAATIESARAMSTVEATATSAQGLLTVTVGSQGEIRSLTFHSQDYRRMAPAELAQAILDTVDKARDSAMRQLVDALPRESLGALNFRDMLSGRVDWDAVLPERLDGFLPGDRKA